MANPKKSNSLVWGLILIAFGLIFLLEQFDVEIWRYVWRLWPVILIVWGIDKLVLGLKEKSERERPPAPPQD